MNIKTLHEDLVGRVSYEFENYKSETLAGTATQVFDDSFKTVNKHDIELMIEEIDLTRCDICSLLALSQQANILENLYDEFLGHNDEYRYAIEIPVEKLIFDRFGISLYDNERDD